jgi:DNA topoisomerase I
MTRLRTVTRHDRGWTRVRRGRGFSYVDEQGRRLGPGDVERVRALVIPPAWRDVWICPAPNGHLQAVGTDEAGRLQYLYHPAWREQRDLEKFDRVLDMAARLPRARRTLRKRLRDCSPTSRDAVLDAAVRLVDLGCFRLGSESYLEDYGSYGLTTLERGAMRRRGDTRVFAFVAKSGVEQEIGIDDPQVVRVLDALAQGRRPSSRLLSYRDARRWHPLTSAEVNERVGDLLGMEVTAKDFRTWHATVTVALALAAVERHRTPRGRASQVRAAVEDAAELLGNTPAVARSSYVDPRVVDLFDAGEVADRARTEDGRDRAVVALLHNRAG